MAYVHNTGSQKEVKLCYNNLDQKTDMELEAILISELGVVSGKRAEYLHNKKAAYFKEFGFNKVRQTDDIRDLGLAVLLNRTEPEYFVKPYSCVTSSYGQIIGYTMEYLGSTDLSKTIKAFKRKPLDSREDIYVYADETKKALSNVHKNGLYHGDLWNQNIMVLKNGKVKLIDPSFKPEERNGAEWGRTYDKTALRLLYEELESNLNVTPKTNKKSLNIRSFSV